MKIVVLDGKTTNPGDISWEPLERLGELTVYGDTAYEEIPSRGKEAQALVLNRCMLDRSMLERLPNLHFVGMLATGYNAIDTKAARERGITVCNVPHYCVETVAQHAFSLLLHLCSQCAGLDSAVKSSGWKQAEALGSGPLAMTELSGKTLGILAFGNIGQAMAKMGQAFGMKVIFYSRSPKSGFPDSTQVDLPTLFSKSDVLSIHCALTPETKGLVSRELISRMKPTALLINTARGALVDEQALADALNENRLAGAGLDVLSKEPPLPENPLLTARNCVITPHVAWSSREARERLISTVAENLQAFQQGHPQNVVNP